MNANQTPKSKIPNSLSKVVIHKNETVTYWSVYDQVWMTEPIHVIPDQELSAMTPENRNKVLRVRDGR